MKKIFFLMTAICILSSVACAAMEESCWNERTGRYGRGIIYGDEKFKEKISELAEDKYDDCIYVSTDGDDDTGNGSTEKPYGSIGAALSKVKAGQTVYVRGGRYYEQLVMEKSGTEDKYINIMSYPGERAILDNSRAADENGTQVDFNGMNYIRFEGFEICNNNTEWAYAIYLGNSESHIIIRNNEIHDIKAKNPNDGDGSGANAVLLYGEKDSPINNVLIADNLIYGNDTGWSEALSVAGNCEYINVFGNRIKDNTNIGIDFCGNFGYCKIAELDQPRYCIARGNIVSNCICPYATSYGLYIDGARDCIFENNISYENMGGIEIGSEEKKVNTPVKNIIVRNNLVFGNSEYGISAGGYDKKVGVVKDVKIYNNTIIGNCCGSKDNEWNGEIHLSLVDGAEISNNIIYDSANGTMIVCEFGENYTKNVSFNNNLYYTSAKEDEIYFEMYGKDVEGLKNWKKYEERCKYGNPEFTNWRVSDIEIGCMPGDASAAKDSGKENIEYGEYDIRGEKRVSGKSVDCGCIEIQQERIKGDADGDRLLSANDAAIVLGKYDESGNEIFDFNDDGVIGKNDAEEILRYVLTYKQK